MKQNEFYKLADEIASSDLEENDPVYGKDKAFVDLLMKAYEEDLSIYAAGQNNLGNGLVGLTGIPLPSLGRNAQALICFTSPETAKKEPDHLEKIQIKVRELFKYIYMSTFFVGLLVNNGIDGVEIAVGIDDLTKWLTPSARADIKEAQNKTIAKVPSAKRLMRKL